MYKLHRIYMFCGISDRWNAETHTGTGNNHTNCMYKSLSFEVFPYRYKIPTNNEHGTSTNWTGILNNRVRQTKCVCLYLIWVKICACICVYFPWFCFMVCHWSISSTRCFSDPKIYRPIIFSHTNKPHYHTTRMVRTINKNKRTTKMVFRNTQSFVHPSQTAVHKLSTTTHKKKQKIMIFKSKTYVFHSFETGIDSKWMKNNLLTPSQSTISLVIAWKKAISPPDCST